MMQAITPFDVFTYPHILSQVFLILCDRKWERKGEAVCTFVYVCVWTLGTLPSLIHGDEVDRNLFCMSAADSCSGPLAGSATSFHLLAKPSSAAWFTANGMQVNLLAISAGRSRERRLYAGPRASLKPQSLHRSWLELCVIFCHLNYFYRKWLWLAALSAELKSYSRGVGWLQASCWVRARRL